MRYCSQAKQSQRCNKIELFFDTKRPCVQQGLRESGRIEIALLRQVVMVREHN